MRRIDTASEQDIPALVPLQCALFREDAGVHDPWVDVEWSVAGSAADFAQLLANPDALVLVARVDDAVVGYLAAYLAAASPTRRPGTAAVLRSLYVVPEVRSSGVAGELTERFLDWARDRGCTQARVDCYVANAPAQRLYERHGFEPVSTTRVITL